MDPYQRISYLLADIIREGCLPEFDQYRDDDTGETYWVCSFHSQGSFAIGIDPKTSIHEKGLLELLLKVAERLGIEEEVEEIK